MLASAEESLAQVRGRASRIGLVPRHLLALEGPDVQAIEAAVEHHHPASWWWTRCSPSRTPRRASSAGSVAQVRACVERLTRLAKSSGVPFLVVGHVTKDGDPAGPRAVEHLVDTVLSFDGDRHHALRALTFGQAPLRAGWEVGLFEMADDGVRDVADPGPLLLGDRMADVPGSVVVPVLQGRRPLLVEVQALPGPGTGGRYWAAGSRRPRGSPTRRANLLLAVLACRTAVEIPASAQMFAAAAGGITVTEPAADLAGSRAMAARHHRLSLPRPTSSSSGSSGPRRRGAYCPRRGQPPGRGAPGRFRPGAGARAHGGGAPAAAPPGLAVHGLRTLAEALGLARSEVVRGTGRVRCLGWPTVPAAAASL